MTSVIKSLGELKNELKQTKKLEIFLKDGLKALDRLDFEKTVEYLSQAYKRRTREDFPHMEYGKALLWLRWAGRERLDEAIEQFIEATAQEGPKAYVSLGRAWARKGDRERAYSCFTKAISIAPEEPEFYWCRASAYENDGELEKSACDLETAINLAKASYDSASYKDHGHINFFLHEYCRVLTKKGDIAHAIKVGERTFRYDPEDAIAHLMLAEIYESQGKVTLAKIHYENFLQNEVLGPIAKKKLRGLQ